MAFLNIREKNFVLITGAILCFLLWMQFLIFPILNYKDRINKDLMIKSSKLQEVKKSLKDAAQSNANDAFKRFVSGSSRQEDMARMIKEIESAASGANLRILETKPQPLVKNTDWYELKVSIVFDGKWSEVVKFLYQLESNSKPLVINEMSLESNLPQQTSVHGRLEIGRILISQ